MSMTYDLEGELDAANRDRRELAVQLEAVADRAYAAEARLIVASGLAGKLLARTGLTITVDAVIDQVNRGLARDLIREQQSHARTRARLEETLHHLEELQIGGRIQSALERAAVSITARPYAEVVEDSEPVGAKDFDEIFDDTIDAPVSEVEYQETVTIAETFEVAVAERPAQPAGAL